MEVDEDIIKSPYDKRKYRYLKLINNLKVLLVSDDTTEKAAAALSVRIGSLSDPDQIPGLAHFCEHMLFLGTKKYPSENEYTEYVSRNGGTFNACTTDEFTTFFFDITCDHLKGALDRFAQFFICPLFNPDAKDREVNAVESENEKNMQVDGWRFRQVCRMCCKPKHPYRKFASGNKQTLEARPQELGIDVRAELLKFHSTNYSSNIMCLVVIGKESLDELQAIILELFSSVEDKNVPVPSFDEPPYSENELQMWLEYVPVKDVRQVNLDFPLPDLTEYYDCDPSSYVAHLIGHEGGGSLLSHLRAKGWCNFLEAGPSLGAKGFMFFGISVDLTEEGEGHVKDVVMAVFQYLEMVRREGPQLWIFQECASLDEIDFRFREKEKPLRYAHHLTHSLAEHPPRDLLCAGQLRTYRPDLIEMVLSKLHPQFVRVGVLSQKFEGKTDLVEPWYGSAYNTRKIEPELIDLWSRVQSIPELHLPECNEFIPTDFEIVPKPSDRDLPKKPELIKDTPLTKVWFKQDDTFFYPKANLYFKLSSPLVYKDPLCNSQSLLFVHLLMDDLKEYSYNAEMAGIESAVSIDVYSVLVKVAGYNHKQAILLSKVISKMTNFTVDRKRFEIFKEMLSRQLKNFRAEQPHTHAMYYTGIILDSMAWTRSQIAEALENVTCEMLQSFITNFFSHSHIEALLHGNLTKEKCLELVGIVEGILKSEANVQPLPSPLELHRQISLPHKSAFTFTTKNEVHNSCCIELYLQIGVESARSNMLVSLMAQILREPCFDTLRTKEQLGYIVASGSKFNNGVSGFRVLAQSMKPSTFVERRIEAFLIKARELLGSITDDVFEEHKKALAMKKLEKPKKLKEETTKYWGEITTHHYHFNRDETEVASLNNLTKTDVVDFFEEYIGSDAPLRHKLTVHVIPDIQNQTQPNSDAGTIECDGAEEETNSIVLPESQRIVDISEFKSKLPLYPSVKPYANTMNS